MTRCPYCGDPMIGHPTACRPTKFWQALQTVPAPVPDNMTTDPPPVLRRDCPFCRDELALLRAEVADLTAERDRLRAVLDAERGERGPDGWRWEDFGRAGEWRYPTPTGAGSLIVRRSMSVRRWVLERWHDGEFVSAHDYALEAMEAADRAAEGMEG